MKICAIFLLTNCDGYVIMKIRPGAAGGGASKKNSPKSGGVVGDLSRGSGKAKISLALVLGTHHLASLDKLTEQGAHTLVAQLSAGRDGLLNVRDRVQRTRGHGLDDLGLDALVGNLHSRGLLLSRILLGQQLDLVVDESHQSRILGNLGDSTQDGKILTLGHLFLVHHSSTLTF